MFPLWCIDWLRGPDANQFLCISVLRVASRPRVKLVDCKCTLNPAPPQPVVYATGCSKAIVLVLSLLCVTLWLILRDGVIYIKSCLVLVLVIFGPFSIAITLLEEERACICVCLFCECWFVFFLFLLVSGIGCDLWLWHSLDFSFYLFVVRTKNC